MAFGRTTGIFGMGLLMLVSVAVEAQNAKPNLPTPAIADGSYSNIFWWEAS